MISIMMKQLNNFLYLPNVNVASMKISGQRALGTTVTSPYRTCKKTFVPTKYYKCNNECTISAKCLAP